tara:strand:+ start:153 stop:566 length:414 start_codon:yes stop_codon:yes gene_type:complete
MPKKWKKRITRSWMREDPDPELEGQFDAATAKVLRLKDELRELNPDAILFDNLDEALVGIGSAYPGEPCAIYSEHKILSLLRVLVSDQSQLPEREFNFTYSPVPEDESYVAAEEWYEHNIACLHAGPFTPIIINLDL